MSETPRPPHVRRRFDARGHFVGYTREGHLEAPREAACEEAVGKTAIFDDLGRTGRITDVIFELDTGEIWAYEFVDEVGTPFYLPAAALHHETASELHFPAGAIALASADLVTLGESLAAGPPPRDPDEFTIVEHLPGRDEGA